MFISECPRSNDRMERFACPSPDFRGRFRCIDDRSLCDGFFDCPGREDENPDQCLFYKTVSSAVDAKLSRRAFLDEKCIPFTNAPLHHTYHNNLPEGELVNQGPPVEPQCGLTHSIRLMQNKHRPTQLSAQFAGLNHP